MYGVVTWVCLEKLLITMSEGLQHNWQFFPEDVESEIGDQVVQKVAAADVAVNVERHLSLHSLPLRHHFVPLQLAVPSFQLLQYQRQKHF
jgi:hypothetical protein